MSALPSRHREPTRPEPEEAVDASASDLDHDSVPTVDASVALLEGGCEGEQTLDGSAFPTELVGTRVGFYRLESVIGSGGTGAVYRARHEVLGTSVAIKILHVESSFSRVALERFVRESRAPRSIDSPHVPRCFDVGRLPSGRPFAVMELVEGQTLEAVLARGTPSIATACRVLALTARALRDVHQAGIVHRDIKPSNIVLSGTGRDFTATIIDFGLARARGSKTVTRAGVFVGTPQYSAPEQLILAAVDTPADVYALGTLSFEMLSGALPFEGTLGELFRIKLRQEAPSLHGVPAPLADLVADMLSRDPARRPSLDHVIAIAEAHTNDRPSSALLVPKGVSKIPPAPEATSSAAIPAQLSTRSCRLGSALLAAAMFAIATVGALWIDRETSAQDPPIAAAP